MTLIIGQSSQTLMPKQPSKDFANPTLGTLNQNPNTSLFKLGSYSSLSSIIFFLGVGIGVSHPIWIHGGSRFSHHSTYGQCTCLCPQCSPLWYVAHYHLPAFWGRFDGEIDICICKPFDAINNDSISHFRYEIERNQWVLKTSCVAAAAEDESDEEVAMDIPPTSPTGSLSLPIGVGFSVAPFNYASAFQNLYECLNTTSLNVQQMHLDHQDTNNFLAY